MSLQSTIGVAVAASLVLGSRAARTSWRRKQVAALAEGAWDGFALPALRLRIPGRLDALRVDPPPSGFGALTSRELLLPESVKGKARVFELVSGARRSRRMVAIRQRGGEIEALVAPSVPDLANLLTTTLLASTVGLLFHVPWPYFAVVGIVGVGELALRTRLPEGRLRETLVGRLPGR